MRRRTDSVLVTALLLAGAGGCSSLKDPTGFSELTGTGAIDDGAAGTGGSGGATSDAPSETANADDGDGAAGEAPCTAHVPADFATLADAVNGAADGAVVCVADGNYTEVVLASHINKTLTLRAASPNTVWGGQLLLNGSPGEGKTFVVEGFTMGCSANNVSVRSPAGRVVIRRNVFNHAAPGDSGAVCDVAIRAGTGPTAGNTTILVEQNEFHSAPVAALMTDPGGGKTGSMILKNNLLEGANTVNLISDTSWFHYIVVGNTMNLATGYPLLLMDLGAPPVIDAGMDAAASDDGGADASDAGGDASDADTDVSDTGADAPVLGQQGQDSVVANNILVGGKAVDGGSPGPAISCLTCARLSVHHNLIFAPISVTGNAVLGDGNLSADPAFVDPTSDWHLGDGSPCFYSGLRDPAASADDDLADDLSGFPRPRSIIDMGAYQHHGN